MPDQKTMRTRCLGGFSVMWVPKLLISLVKIRILFILGQVLSAHLVPCWWVGWWLWRAGCILQDSYLLYYSIYFFCNLYADKNVKELACILDWSTACLWMCLCLFFGQMWNHHNWTLQKLQTRKRIKEHSHTSYLSFFLHWQNFWKIKFTPKNANFSR